MNRLASAALAAFITLFHASLALAAPTGENTKVDLDSGPSNAAPSGAGGGSLARTFVGLAVVIAVIYGVYWVLKQVKSSREEKAVGFGLSTVATLPLGPNRSLHLVRAGDEVLVVGVTEQGLTSLRTYTQDEAKAQGLILDDLVIDEDGAPARPKKTFALPSGLTAPNGKNAIEAIRGWTVRG